MSTKTLPRYRHRFALTAGDMPALRAVVVATIDTGDDGAPVPADGRLRAVAAHGAMHALKYWNTVPVPCPLLDFDTPPPGSIVTPCGDIVTSADDAVRLFVDHQPEPQVPGRDFDPQHEIFDRAYEAVARAARARVTTELRDRASSSLLLHLRDYAEPGQVADNHVVVGRADTIVMTFLNAALPAFAAANVDQRRAGEYLVRLAMDSTSDYLKCFGRYAPIVAAAAGAHTSALYSLLPWLSFPWSC